jgi:hypothetical protein
VKEGFRLEDIRKMSEQEVMTYLSIIQVKNELENEKLSSVNR